MTSCNNQIPKITPNTTISLVRSCLLHVLIRFFALVCLSGVVGVINFLHVFHYTLPSTGSFVLVLFKLPAVACEMIEFVAKLAKPG
jgi:hypothetical protein